MSGSTTTSSFGVERVSQLATQVRSDSPRRVKDPAPQLSRNLHVHPYRCTSRDRCGSCVKPEALLRGVPMYGCTSRPILPQGNTAHFSLSSLCSSNRPRRTSSSNAPTYGCKNVHAPEGRASAASSTNVHMYISPTTSKQSTQYVQPDKCTH